MYFIKSLCDDLFKNSIIYRIFFILFAVETMGTVSYSTYCMTIKDNSDSCLITFGASCLSLMIIGAFLLFSCLFYFIK